jgi:hypothetical protein
MSALEDYFASERQRWLEERREVEAEAYERGVSVDQILFERREAAKSADRAAERHAREAATMEVVRAAKAKRAEMERVMRESQENLQRREANALAAQQAFWQGVARRSSRRW